MAEHSVKEKTLLTVYKRKSLRRVNRNKTRNKYVKELEMKLKPGYCHICQKKFKNDMGLMKHNMSFHPITYKISDEGVIIYEQQTNGKSR